MTAAEKDFLKQIGKLTSVEWLAVNAFILALLIKQGNSAEAAEEIDRLKEKHTRGDFKRAIKVARDLQADARREGNASMYDACERTVSFIRRYLLERGMIEQGAGANNGR